ncbi:MAG TPA: aminotransferase class III-fold pyridoxal phosphate-dependent enzyme [Thermoanaerobaculaceae bacterium]|nr:aminotransferase class III-fold pyridoxal phosphate-dependent enzyme [Thermoanaerobaculaceae bacterium]
MERADESRAATNAASALLDVYEQIPVSLVRGEGVYLFDADGRRYLDFYGGHAVALLGYAHPRLLAALEEQARTLFFQTNVAPLAVRERAAAALARFGPPGLGRVFFVNSGAEANENALRVAFLATRRRRVAAVEGAFHGRTAAVAALTAGHERWYGFPTEPFPVTVVPFDDLAALERAAGEDLAAVIVEPVQGVAGARAMAHDFLAAARRVTAECGALLIFDEVQCGMGRTGFPFAAQAHGITPDLLTVAKGLGGGFPVAAVLLGEALASRVGKGDLGTTFGGGPMAMALAEAVIETLERGALLARVRRLSERIRRECVVGPVTAVQGMGFLLGLRTRPPAKAVIAELRGRGVLAGGSADPHVVRLLPPLILEDRHVDELVAALKGIPC